MWSELETFVQDWEATERSRHVRLLEEVKHEYRSSRRLPTPAEAADLPYSLRLPLPVSQQVQPQNHLPRSSQEKP